MSDPAKTPKAAETAKAPEAAAPADVAAVLATVNERLAAVEARPDPTSIAKELAKIKKQLAALAKQVKAAAAAPAPAKAADPAAGSQLAGSDDAAARAAAFEALKRAGVTVQRVETKTAKDGSRAEHVIKESKVQAGDVMAASATAKGWCAVLIDGQKIEVTA